MAKRHQDWHKKSSINDNGVTKNRQACTKLENDAEKKAGIDQSANLEQGCPKGWLRETEDAWDK
jgi:hypothetical protein